MMENPLKWLNDMLKQQPPQLYECEHCKRDFPSSKIFQSFAHQLCHDCRRKFEGQGIVSYKDIPQVAEFCYWCGEKLVLCSDGWWRCPQCQWESVLVDQNPNTPIEELLGKGKGETEK